MSEEQDRINLADAMGLPCHCNSALSQMPQSPPCKVHDLGDILGCPDPFTDANDDYAVLEWMRPDDWRNSVLMKGPDHVRYLDFIFELRLLEQEDGRPSGPIGQGYVIGDYARAALAVIKDGDT